MQQDNFRIFLENDPGIKSKDKAVRSRISKAIKAEELLGKNLHLIVANDDVMYDALNELQEYENPKHNPMQNAVRKYYLFVSGKEFPQLRYYQRRR